MEIKAIMETQIEATLGMRTDTSIINKIENMEEWISGMEDMMEEINTSAKQNAISKMFVTKNIQTS